MDNLYSVLGISQSATGEEIKKAYRTLSKQYHPDENQGDQAAEARFKEISEAYAILQDPQKRQEYNQSLKEQGGHKKKTGTGRTGPAFTGGAPKMDAGSMDAQFAQFFGFHPKSGEVNPEDMDKTKKTKTNPLDMTDMFERYMGIKK